MSKDKVGFNANRCVICLPPADLDASVEWSINLSSQYWPFNISREFSSQEGTGRNEDPDVLRNHQIAFALAGRARYFWFLKNDNLPPNWAIHRFVEAMFRDPKIMVIAGMCPANVPETTDFCDEVEQVFEDKEGNQFDILQVNPKGSGHVNFECTLVKAEIFDHIGDPWFIKPEGFSSEQNFCWKVMEAGYKVCAHTGVYCGHVDMETGKAHWPEGAVIAA